MSHYRYEEVQNYRSAILARNNIGFLYYSIGLHDEAIRTLEIAESHARKIQDKNHLSVVSDTLARAFIAQGNYRRATEVAAASVCYLESSENSNLLATALITYGIALARNKETQKAKAAFLRAEKVSDFIHDFALAAAARLFALREMFSEYSPEQRLSAYLYAVKNLSGNQENDICDALCDVAGKIEHEHEIEPLAPQVEGKVLPQRFSLDEKLKTISREYMETAIRKTRGNQSQAAALLGMSRQTFLARIKKDFPDLLSELNRIGMPVKIAESPDSHLIHCETNVKNEKFALTEIQADYREVCRGDFLLVKLGFPETNKHIIIGGRSNDFVKIGLYVKNDEGYFLESADGKRFELNETGRNKIIGEVVGFCRQADYRKYLAEREQEGSCELTYEA